MLEQLSFFGNIIILIVGLIALYFASRYTISFSVKIADAIGVSKTAIGFAMIAFLTSLPELMVSIFSVLEPGALGITVGNVMGANVTNFTLVLGLCFLMITLKNNNETRLKKYLPKSELKNLSYGIIFASIVPILLLYLRDVSRFFGVLLLIIFFIYMHRMIKNKQNDKELLVRFRDGETIKYFVGAAGSALLLVIVAYLIVESATYIATSIGIPKLVIGATIISIGTTLPELTTSIIAFKMKQIGLALGNIVGSSIINLSCIMGFALLASPFTVNMSAFQNLVIFTVMANLLVLFLFVLDKIQLWKGVGLLSLYAIFLIVITGNQII